MEKAEIIVLIVIALVLVYIASQVGVFDMLKMQKFKKDKMYEKGFGNMYLPKESMVVPVGNMFVPIETLSVGNMMLPKEKMVAPVGNMYIPKSKAI